jgi:hypothetical protein
LVAWATSLGWRFRESAYYLEHLHCIARGFTLALAHWIMDDWDIEKGELENEGHGDTVDRDLLANHDDGPSSL